MSLWLLRFAPDQELEHAGWRHVRTSGDHWVFQHSEGRISIVSGKLCSMLDLERFAPFWQSGIKEAD